MFSLFDSCLPLLEGSLEDPASCPLGSKSVLLNLIFLQGAKMVFAFAASLRLKYLLWAREDAKVSLKMKRLLPWQKLQAPVETHNARHPCGTVPLKCCMIESIMRIQMWSEQAVCANHICLQLWRYRSRSTFHSTVNKEKWFAGLRSCHNYLKS